MIEIFDAALKDIDAGEHAEQGGLAGCQEAFYSYGHTIVGMVDRELFHKFIAWPQEQDYETRNGLFESIDGIPGDCDVPQPLEHLESLFAKVIDLEAALNDGVYDFAAELRVHNNLLDVRGSGSLIAQPHLNFSELEDAGHLLFLPVRAVYTVANVFPTASIEQAYPAYDLPVTTIEEWDEYQAFLQGYTHKDSTVPGVENAIQRIPSVHFRPASNSPVGLGVNRTLVQIQIITSIE